MVTKFGEFMRVYRMRNGMLLKKMADDLAISPALLSSMEMGRRPISDYIVDKIISTYNLNTEDGLALREAVAQSTSSVKINAQAQDSSRRNLAFTFARKFDGLNDAQVEELMKILKGTTEGVSNGKY